MKRLYSPWRSAYITTFDGNDESGGCPFCRIAEEKRDERHLVIWRGEHCFLMMNLYPYNWGHLMVVPYLHTSNIGSLPAETNIEIMQATAGGMKALSKVCNPQGFNFGVNLGRAAGVGIEQHIHFHVVPRWKADTNFMPVLSEVKVIADEMKKTWRKLRRVVRVGQPGRRASSRRMSKRTR